MEKYFYIQPRQTGKTTYALYELLKDVDNSVLITFNRQSMGHLSDRTGLGFKNFFYGFNNIRIVCF
jgi:hypothetical protein